MTEFDVDEVSLFLGKLGLNEDAEKLRKEDISMDILREMTTDDLRKIGITFGHSLQIRKAVDKSMETDENKELEGGRGATKERTLTDPDDERVPGNASKEDNDETPSIPSVREQVSALNKEKSLPIKVSPNAEEEADEFVELEDEVRIVLLGKTGSGKSATGNTILGREGKFKESSSASSVTADCNRGYSTRFKKDLYVVDTPGLFDTRSSNEAVQLEIAKCIHITAPGPHAFILVLGLTRFTKEEYDAVTHFVNHFGERIYEYFILLFTRKDDLEHENKTLDDYLKNIPGNLRTILEKCGKRCIAFNNRAKGRAQVKQVKSLLKMIKENVLRNGEKHYTNSMYQEAAKLMKEREEKIEKEMEEQKKREIEKMKNEIEKPLKREMEELNKKIEESEKKMKQREEEMKCQVDALEKKRKDYDDIKSELDAMKVENADRNNQLQTLLEANKKMEIEKAAREQARDNQLQTLLEANKKMEIEKAAREQARDNQLQTLLEANKKMEIKKAARKQARENVDNDKGFLKRCWHGFRRSIGNIKEDKLKEEEYIEKALKTYEEEQKKKKC